MSRFLCLVAALLVLILPAHGDDTEIGVYAGHSAAAIVHVNKGTDLTEKGQTDAARREFDEAIRLDPTMWPAYYNRARMEMKLGRLNAALADANQSIRMKPKFWSNYALRGDILAKLGYYKNARTDFYKAVELGPNDRLASVRNDRAWLFATCPDASMRNGKLAISDATMACKATNWRNADYIDTLAAAYAEVGDFTNAMRYQERALSVGNFSPTLTGKSRSQQARDRLQKYKKRLPYRTSRS